MPAPPAEILAPATPVNSRDYYGSLNGTTVQGSTPKPDQGLAQPADLPANVDQVQPCVEAVGTSLGDSGAIINGQFPSGDKSDPISIEECKTVSQLKMEVETLDEKCNIKDRDHDKIVTELKKTHESELKAALKELETITWKRALADNRLKVVVDEKEALDRELKALVEKENGAEAQTQSKDELIQQMSWTQQTLQQQFNDLQVEYNTKCKEALQTAELLKDKNKTILELRGRVLEATNELFSVSQSRQKLEAANDGPNDGHATSPKTGPNHPTGTITAVEDNVDAQPVNEGFNWEQQPGRAQTIDELNHDKAEQCKMLHIELNKITIERDALAAAAVNAKNESDWWFAGGVYEGEEERRIKGDTQQQLVYKDRLLIDLTKRVDKGMTALEQVKERSRREKEDMAAEVAYLKDKLDAVTSALEMMTESKESISKGYQVTLLMLKGKLRHDDIVDAISYYYNTISSDNGALASKVQSQAADLERSREEVALKDAQYRDLSRTSAKQLLTILELQTAYRGLEVEVGRLEAEEVISAQERKEEVERYERQLEQVNAEHRALGEKVRVIIRLGPSERTKSELDDKDQQIERLGDQLWNAERRTEMLLERSRVYMEARESDATFAAVQDREYELYKKRLFAAEADVVALRAELAEKDKMLDDGNPLHLKEAMVYRQALDTEKLNHREMKEKFVEGSILVSQQYEAKIEALEAMGNLLWARSRNLKATLDAHGHTIVEEDGESEGIDAACRTLFGVYDDGSEDGPEAEHEDGPGEEAGAVPGDEVGGVNVSEDDPREQKAVENGDNGPSDNDSRANELSTSLPPNPNEVKEAPMMEVSAENEGGNGSGEEEEKGNGNEDEEEDADDLTIRPQNPSTGARGNSPSDEVLVEDDSSPPAMYFQGATESSWW